MPAVSVIVIFSKPVISLSMVAVPLPEVAVCEIINESVPVPPVNVVPASNALASPYTLRVVLAFVVPPLITASSLEVASEAADVVRYTLASFV